MVMDETIRYIAEPTHVREVTLHGTADLAFWTANLQQEDLLPVNRNGRAQILIVAAEMTYMGIRFTEVSFSVAVIDPAQETQDAAFLAHAFNSFRLFAFCERLLFATPYFHADCQVAVSDFASMRIILDGQMIFRAEMTLDASAANRQPSRSGQESWKGRVFLPVNRRGRGADARFFYGRMVGQTQAYPFVRSTDILSITTCERTEVLQALLDSEFIAEQWVVRADATHGKSKSYRRCDMFGRQTHGHTD